jgi:solute carrier family 35 protein E3
LVTAVFLRLAARAGWLEPKAIERRALLQFSVVNGVSIGFLNLSLGYNSVGFYQMTKLAIIPCTVAIQQTFYQKQVRSIHWFPYDRAGEVDADP